MMPLRSAISTAKITPKRSKTVPISNSATIFQSTVSVKAPIANSAMISVMNKPRWS